MIKKYGSIVGKEKMLFHGTSVQNLGKINADGLNRIYAGAHGKVGGSSRPTHHYETDHLLYVRRNFVSFIKP